MSNELVVIDANDELATLNPASIVPIVVQRAGPRAEERFYEFFAANIRNPNTRAAYLHAAKKFFAWIETNNLELGRIRPLHVAGYIELLGREVSPPTVKQHLAAIRMLFDYFVIAHVIDHNPASSVRGPKYSVKKGKTPVLDQEEAQLLLASIDTSHVVGLRDKAVIGLMVYTFARVSAMVSMNLEDYYPQGKRWWIRLHEKGGKLHEVPAHHKLEELIDAYMQAADLGNERKTALFRSTVGRTRKLNSKRMTRRHVYEMVRRRAKEAGILSAIGCHSFRATGITNYLEHGGTLEKAQQLANHESARTTKLYDRRDDRLSLDEVEKIMI